MKLGNSERILLKQVFGNNIKLYKKWRGKFTGRIADQNAYKYLQRIKTKDEKTIKESINLSKKAKELFDIVQQILLIKNTTSMGKEDEKLLNEREEHFYKKMKEAGIKDIKYPCSICGRGFSPLTKGATSSCGPTCAKK